MIKKKYLSTKRNRKVSFAASDVLLDWMKRYISEMRKKNPDDLRYKSLSSFIYCVLEDIMNLFQKSKTLEDIENIPDLELTDFYDNITFKAVIPLFEEIIAYNKYRNTISNNLFRLFMSFRNFFTKNKDLEQLDRYDMMNTIERFSKFLLKNKITESFDSFFDGNTFVVEYKGKYTNLHYEISKLMAALIGITGLRLRKVEYVKKFTQYYFETDWLMKSRKLNIKERKRLANENLNKFIKLDHILNDKMEYFWINLSNNLNITINFPDFKTGLTYVNSQIEELQKIVPHADIKKYILKMFEHFHWLIIIDENSLIYDIILPEENHKIEHEIMFEILSKKVNYDKYLKQII